MKTDSDPMGWRMAGLTVLLALALTASAYYIHTKVYCDPAHPSCIKTSPAQESHGTADASHAPAGGGHDAAHAPAAGGASQDAGKHAPTDTGKKDASHGKGG